MSSQRGKLAVALACTAIPYVLLTFHYSTTHLEATTSERKKLDLSAYWSVIHDAQRLLDSLNATESLKPDEAKGRNLVVGLAREIPVTNLAVFLNSLRKVSSADVLLFVDEPSKDAEIMALKKNGVDLRFYDPESFEPPWLRSYHPSSFRWPLIAEALKDLNYDGVLFADVRDTAFQKDPFDGTISDKFYAVHGVESRTIGQCGWNGGWIKDCFGEKKLRALSNKPILCSGVSLATSFHVALKYAQQMAAVIAHEDFKKCERNGVDQGVHNVLVHDNMVLGSQIVPQRASRVANLQAKVAIVHNNNVLRASDRTPVAVVHQYDRFPDLAAFYYRTYGLPEQQAGDIIGGGGPATDACAAYEVRPNVDLFKAKCDLTATSGTSVRDCCKSCNRAQNCNGFTLAGSLCYLKTCRTPVTDIRMPGASSGFLRDGQPR